MMQCSTTEGRNALPFMKVYHGQSVRNDKITKCLPELMVLGELLFLVIS